MMDKQVSEYCTGCGLCACQNKAVLRKDEKGFLYPESGDKEWLKKYALQCHSWNQIEI